MKQVDSIINSVWWIDKFMRRAKQMLRSNIMTSPRDAVVIFIRWENLLWNSCWMLSAETTRALNWTKLCYVALCLPWSHFPSCNSQNGPFHQVGSSENFSVVRFLPHNVSHEGTVCFQNEQIQTYLNQFVSLLSLFIAWVYLEISLEVIANEDCDYNEERQQKGNNSIPRKASPKRENKW